MERMEVNFKTGVERYEMVVAKSQLKYARQHNFLFDLFQTLPEKMMYWHSNAPWSKDYRKMEVTTWKQ